MCVWVMKPFSPGRMLYKISDNIPTSDIFGTYHSVYCPQKQKRSHTTQKTVDESQIYALFVSVWQKCLNSKKEPPGQIPPDILTFPPTAENPREAADPELTEPRI